MCFILVLALFHYLCVYRKVNKKCESEKAFCFETNSSFIRIEICVSKVRIILTRSGKRKRKIHIKIVKQIDVRGRHICAHSNAHARTHGIEVYNTQIHVFILVATTATYILLYMCALYRIHFSR